jgi:hypothetical protein
MVLEVFQDHQVVMEMMDLKDLKDLEDPQPIQV